MKPLLSIVIPSNNRTVLLDEAIVSIITDSSWNSDCELCISDNSKGDETGTLIRTKYSGSSQIVYRRSLDAPSLDENVDMAISMASGKYVWVFGDDDLIVKDFLAELITYLKSSSPDIVILNSCSFQEQGQVEESRLALDSLIVYGHNDNDSFLADQGAYLTYVPCILIRKKLWEKCFRSEKVGTFFAHIDAVCRAKIGHTAHYLPRPAIKMRLHMQTWTANHFEIWNIYFPEVIWTLDNYSLQAKQSVIQRYPLKSVKRILASRAYGRFDFNIFKTILLPYKDSSLIVKVSSFIISIIPRELFRRLYVSYIWFFRNKHSVGFSPKLALAQLQRRK
ncbi:glycosyltransferase [bacterium]|nr:glycosyltransferase [bacterium]